MSVCFLGAGALFVESWGTEEPIVSQVWARMVSCQIWTYLGCLGGYDGLSLVSS